MKTNWLVGSIFLAGTMVLHAQTNDLSAALRQGLFEEEANRNLDGAISNYQAVATQFDQDRQIAATAIFRLGECYRKLGQTNEAAAQYQRIVREFSDQTTLATLSRQNLTGMGMASPPRFQERLQAIVAKNPQDSAAPTTDSEDLETRRIQQMIKNSPDLINARPSGYDFTPLGDAARQGQIKVATFLLDHGADINVEQRDGETALHGAARAGNRAMVELLLSRGADVNAKGRAGDTALHQTALRGYQAVAEVLLANHSDVNALNVGGSTPLFSAASSGQLKIVRMLLAAGANTNLKDVKGRSPLNYAIGNTPEIFQALLDAGTNPNTEDSEGRTPLSYAAERDNSKVVRLLLAAKADPNGGKLDAPLLCAIHKQDVVSAKLLLESGANSNLRGGMDWQATVAGTTYSGANSQDRAACTPLYLAVSTGQLPMVNLLLQFKADPNDSQTDGRTLLFSALSNPDILEALLAAGGNADSRLPGGTTVLDQAVNGNSPKAVVDILLKHGADPNVRDLRGNPPLYYAIWGSPDPGKIELLLNHHADPNVQGENGQTPLDYIKSHAQSNIDPVSKADFDKIAGLLRRHGALDNLPHWDRITVSRPAASYSKTIFQKGTNDWNRFTLLETLLNFYAEQSQSPRLPPFGGGADAGIPLPFPDLTRATIIRHPQNTTNETRIKVDLLSSTNGIDCSRDVPLEFGDVVEIPEREHTLGDQPVGLTDSQRDSIVNGLKGSIRLVVHGGEAELPVYPNSSSLIGSVLNRPEAQGVLLSSSDLSHVKITRHDPVTGKKHEWILDCSHVSKKSYLPFFPGQGDDPHYNAPDFRLRAGDVIEVPEK